MTRNVNHFIGGHQKKKTIYNLSVDKVAHGEAERAERVARSKIESAEEKKVCSRVELLAVSSSWE